MSYIVVKLQSRGSFIYIQNRIGRNSRLFKIYKIRTMHSNHNNTEPALDKDDPRIFRYGKFLRRSRLDELPQFINVIKGDMHIAGPRAEWDQYHDLYLNNIEQYELEILFLLVLLVLHKLCLDMLIMRRTQGKN